MSIGNSTRALHQGSILQRCWRYISPQSAVLHVTHYKAGSQWIHRILGACCPPERLVSPLATNDHLRKTPVAPGLVYPTVYATREQLDQLALPRYVRRFVVIRDLRDTLVSLYFSHKYSHIDNASVNRTRPILNSMDLEEGLIYAVRNSSQANAAIIRSWMGTKDPLIRYEDLLENDEAILTRVLLDQCKLAVPRDHLIEAIRINRFDKLAKGRRRGQEDPADHFRKGTAGDWRNYFTPRVKEVFKQTCGDVLIASGYERDNNW